MLISNYHQASKQAYSLKCQTIPLIQFIYYINYKLLKPLGTVDEHISIFKLILQWHSSLRAQFWLFCVIFWTGISWHGTYYIISCCRTLYRCCPSLPPIHPSHAIFTQHTGVGGGLKRDTVFVMWPSVCAFCNLCMMKKLKRNPLLTSHHVCVYLTRPNISSEIVFCIFNAFNGGLESIFIPQGIILFMVYASQTRSNSPLPPNFPLKFMPAVTFRSARAWFIPTMYGAAFLFFFIYFFW